MAYHHVVFFIKWVNFSIFNAYLMFHALIYSLNYKNPLFLMHEGAHPRWKISFHWQKYQRLLTTNASTSLDTRLVLTRTQHPWCGNVIEMQFRSAPRMIWLARRKRDRLRRGFKDNRVMLCISVNNLCQVVCMGGLLKNNRELRGAYYNDLKIIKNPSVVQESKRALYF